MRASILRLGVLASLLASPAFSAIFIVTKASDDDGACTPDDCALREAVLAANALPGLDRIEVPAGTYQLSLVGPDEDMSMTGDLDIRDAVEIVGDAVDLPTIIGDGTDRVIHAEMPHSVLLSNLVITGGVSTNSGGGVRSISANLTMTRCVVTGNRAERNGGGLFLGAASAVVSDTAIFDNEAGVQGGGIQVSIFSPFDFVDMENVTISGNTASSGGGMYISAGAPSP